MKIGYARVSTKHQDLAAQEKQLRQLGVGCCCNLGREPRKLRFYCVINAMCLCCQAVSNTRLTITASGFG